jgi:Lipase maturation factor
MTEQPDTFPTGFRAWLGRAQARHSYWLTRFVILRLLGFVYLAAFISLARQVLPLIGSNGLLPAQDFLASVQAHFGSRLDGFLALPSLFWFGISDHELVVLAWIGAVLSLVVMLGYANALLLAVLWLLYTSFVNIGQDWYAYGWEIQLLETGFLAMFLCPLLDPRPFPKRPPPVMVIWLFRWLSFRIMFGAGLIKLRGDSCWRDLTCLYYHYETQPIPNPLSRMFHFMPHWFQKFSTLWNHFVELIVPWFGFGPRRARHIAGVLLVSFQVILIISGNLSFLNYLTIVPMLACFDDSLLSRFLPKALVERARRASENNPPTRAQEILSLGFAIVVVLFSFAPTLNLLSGEQVMNASFDRLHLVNTYGAFGSVGRERNEIIFEGSNDGVLWRAYEFPFKPGDPMRRPGLAAPYQPRLDWAIWFAAMSSPNQYPWTLHVIWKLLHNDAGTLSLLAHNPFSDKPPRFIRAQLYRYRFAPPGNPSGAWWDRELIGPWLPPLSTEDRVWTETHRVFGWPK